MQGYSSTRRIGTLQVGVSTYGSCLREDDKKSRQERLPDGANRRAIFVISLGKPSAQSVGDAPIYKLRTGDYSFVDG